MDSAELFGRVIKVNQAKPQKEANEGLGSRTAVWEQVCLKIFFFFPFLFFSPSFVPHGFGRVRGCLLVCLDVLTTRRCRRGTRRNSTRMKKGRGMGWRTRPTAVWILCKALRGWLKPDRDCSRGR